jgi:hypothetical protein
MIDDRRKNQNGSNHRNGDDRREVLPLRVVEETISYDTLSAVQHLEDLVQSGDCLGIAFGAILRGGKIAQGYTGAAVEQPSLAVGILSQVIFDIQYAQKNEIKA